MNALIEQANMLLKNQPFSYALAGGWAIDLFIGTESRKHGDIDILAFWPERDKIILYMQSLGFEVYEMLGGGKVHRITDISYQMRNKRNIFCAYPDCELIQLIKTDVNDILYMDFKHIGQTDLNFIEFLFNDKSATELLYARNNMIRRSLDKAILFNDETPYLSPEFCLLYKSTDTEREGYQHDYDSAIEKMNIEQKLWLNAALSAMYPNGHKWKT